MSSNDKIMNSQMACVLMDQARTAFNEVLKARRLRPDMPFEHAVMKRDHSNIIKAILSGDFQVATDLLSIWTEIYTPHAERMKAAV